jgi:hypothetical protein
MTRLPAASILLLAVAIAAGCGRHHAAPPAPPSPAAEGGFAVPEPTSPAVKNGPAETGPPPAAAPGQAKAAPEAASPLSSVPKTASAKPATRPAPPSPSTPHKIPDEILVRLIEQYPHLMIADVLDAKPTGNGWTLRIRDPEGIGAMMMEFRIAYEKKGYAAKECRVKVVNDLAHGTLVMTRGAQRVALSCDEDPAEKNISNVRLAGPPPVPGQVNAK